MNPGYTKEWLLTIAVGLIVVAIGSIIDILLKKQDIKHIHDRLLKWEDEIRQIPLTHWQIRIAKTWERFFTNLHNTYLNPFNWFDRPKKEWLATIGGIAFIIQILGFFYLYLFTDFWLFGILLLPTLIYMFLIIVNLFHKVSDNFGSFIITASLFSAIASGIAMILSIKFIPANWLNSFWFITHEGIIKPRLPIVIAIINYIFDFTTIALTTLLLKKVAELKRFFFAIALVDMLLSGILALIMLCVLCVSAGNWAMLPIEGLVRTAISWTKQFMDFLLRGDVGVSPVPSDMHLVPLLLTTFVPVFIYMFIFTVISILKPFLYITGRLFGAISEKDESAFKQIATVIAVIIAALKAIYDYIVV